MEIGVSGQYEIYKNGELVGKTDNMILDGYFTRHCSGLTNKNGHIWCGSGATAVLAANTGLETVIAASYKSVASPSTSYELLGGTHFGRFKWNALYLAGDFTGTVREVGFRMHTSTADPADSLTDSRALVRDVNGNTTEITVTASDALTIIFIFKMQVPTGLVATEGVFGGTKHTLTWEALQVGTSRWYSVNLLHFHATDPTYNETAFSWYYLRTYDTQELVNDPTGDVTQAATSGTSGVIGVVTSGSNWIKHTMTFTATQAALVAGVKYISLEYRSGDSYIFAGIHANPPISDSVSRDITIEIKYTFVRGQESAGGFEGQTLTAMSLPSTITEIDIPVGAFTSRGRAVATPIGGKAPYTYAWTRPGAAGTPALTADSPTSASTTFSATGASLNSSSEVWRCTITDDNGDTATADTTVALTWAA